MTTNRTDRQPALARLSRLSPAALLRSIAGIPAGAQPTRRGTVLVLILGALALISVVTLVYATIGQGDRRAAAVVLTKDTQNRGIEQIADYLARVIAGDVLDVYVDGERLVGGNRIPIYVREATDYPFTDHFRKSIQQYGNTTSDTFAGFPIFNRRFSPGGAYYDLLANANDPRLPSDAWLSRLEPERIIDTGAAPVASELRDWFQISNFAPDGRFINLFNFRNNFESRPGYQPLAGLRPSQTSAYLTLYNPATGQPYPAGSAQPLAAPGYFQQASGATANPNIPAHWTMYQAAAYRPIRGSTLPVSDPNWTGYQWADADGDGFADSRWFELVDSWDLANPIFVIPRDDNYRWVVAARAVDLSGLANLNTGTDSQLPAMSSTGTPAPKLPHGLVPEIDIRRLFTLGDVYFQYGAAEGYQALGPDQAGYNEAQARAIGSAAYDVHQNVLTPDRTEIPPVNALFNPVAHTGDDRFTLFDQQAGALNYGLLTSTVRGMRSSGPFGTADLLELLTYFGINDPNTTSRLEQTLGGRGVANRSLLRDTRPLSLERPFDTWLEVRAYNPANPPAANTPERFSFNRAAYDVRHLLTTVSGARLIRTAVRPIGGVYHLGGAELPLDPRPALEAASSTNTAPNSIFRAYADALMPYAGILNGWISRSSNTRHIYQTLFFGNDPEKALRTAAHMTVNLKDAYDDDGYTSIPGPSTGRDRHTVYRVPLKHGVNLAGSPYPILNLEEDLPTSAQQQDYRLAASADQVYAVPGAEYIDVIGIEAQPFVAQVTSYCLYADADSPNGDTEAAGEEMTIRGAVTLVSARNTPYPTDNKDYLGQVLAFQLVNPFDRDIDLSSYYLQYGEGEYYFKLSGTLDAGQARVYYVPNCTDIETRWRNVEPVLQAGVFEAWANKQFTITDSSGDPILPVLIEKYENPTLALTQPVDFFDSPVGNPHKMGTVYLWFDAVEPDPGDPWDFNNLLIDRLRDTQLDERTSPTLDVRLPAGNNDIAGTNIDDGDDGWAIALTATIKRSDDPTLMNNGTLPLGALPAYCIEPQDEADGSGGWKTDFTVYNPTFQQPGNLVTPARSDFDPPFGGDDPMDILDPATVPVFVDSIAEHPEDKQTDWLGSNLDGVAFTGGTGTTSGTRNHPPLSPEIFLKNDKFEEQITVGPLTRTISTMRITDLLMPLGIGPMMAPVPPPGPGDVGDPYPGRLTLSEALALALNYTTFEGPITDASNPRYVLQPYRDIGKFGVGALDRGNLVLDDFAPFEDVNTDGFYDAGDRRRTPGIPLALNILNTFTTLPNQDALKSFTPGLVNINTMPLSVGRAIGLLSPTTENAGAVHNNWKTEAGLIGTPLPTLPEPPDGAGQGSDIAASVIAYRDQSNVWDLSGRAVNYLFRTLTPAPSATPNPPAGYPDWASGIPGLRGRAYDDPSSSFINGASGFGSIGELLCVIRRDQARMPVLTTAPLHQNGIDFLGSDESGGTPADSGSKGMLTARYNSALPGQTPAVMRPDTMPNNYAEKLLLASGILNSVTVRSDVFAVWFVVNGYSRQDCEDLAPTDPLVPSVAKRFLMVIDRSNVTTKGEKPRILLFSELPM